MIAKADRFPEKGPIIQKVLTYCDVIMLFCRLLQTKECADEQFTFELRGDITVKGVKLPMKCYVLSRNLRKLPKVQLLLESNLTMSRSPSPSSPCEILGKMAENPNI